MGKSKYRVSDLSVEGMVPLVISGTHLGLLMVDSPLVCLCPGRIPLELDSAPGYFFGIAL